MTRSTRAEATRRAILEAALACFGERGFSGTTTRAIAKRAGVTQPLIHHYFGSKRALFDAVLSESFVQYELAQAEQWERPMDDLAFFTVGMTVLFRWTGANRALLRLAEWSRLEGIRIDYAEGTDIWLRVLARLEAIRDAGHLREDVDLDVLMLQIDSLFKGYWDRREEHTLYPLDPAGLDERYLRQCLRVFLRAALRPEAAETALASLD